MADGDRNLYENLVYLCPTHALEIDQQPDRFPVALLLQWRNDHEARVRQAIARVMSEIHFAELEVVAKALLGAALPEASDFSLTDPAEKLRRNGLSAKIRFLLQTGLSQAGQVHSFIQRFAETDAEFPERLKAGFVAEYRRLLLGGLTGDALFLALAEFASLGSGDFHQQAAGIAVLSYLFEACEVFEK